MGGYDAYTNATTVSMWCYLKSNSSLQYFFNKHDSLNSSVRFLSYTSTGGDLVFTRRDSSDPAGARVTYSNFANNILNKWVHIAFVSSGSDFTLATNMSVYVDGVIQTPSSSTDGDGFSSGEESGGIFTLGARYYDDTRNMEADFQNVRIWNRALTPTEVSRLYTEPWAGLEPLSPFSFFSGLSQIYAYYSAAFLQRL